MPASGEWTVRHVFEQAGVPSYRLFDPDDLSITVLELDGAAYREVALAGRSSCALSCSPWRSTACYVGSCCGHGGGR